MYTVNFLDTEEMEWKPLCFKEIPMQFGSKQTLFKALKDNLGVSVQVLYNGWYLDGLNGTEEQLAWHKRRHDILLEKIKWYMSCQENYENKQDPVQKVKKKV